MVLFHIVILALIQGITEFLPISSSGHLVLAHAFMDGAAVDEAARWAEDLTMDVAVHVGTLFAVLLYFYRDIWSMVRGLIGLLCINKAATEQGGADQEGAQLCLYVVLASLPVIVAGFALHAWAPAFVRSVEIMAWATLIFGIVLWAADHFSPADKMLVTLNWKSALLIGLAQVLALIPGTSRSGITMTAGRALGFSRRESARFSLLLAVVAISGAGTLSGIDLWQSGDLALGKEAALAAGLSFVTALGAIALMMKWLEKSSFTPFALYRIILGLILLGLIYSGTL